MFGIRIKDVDCDFRLIRTAYLRRVPLTFASGAIGLELIHSLQVAGCPMAETGVRHYPRLHGRSEFFSLKHVTSLICDVLRFWWQLRRPSGRGVPSPEARGRSQIPEIQARRQSTRDSGLRTPDLEES